MGRGYAPPYITFTDCVQVIYKNFLFFLTAGNGKYMTSREAAQYLGYSISGFRKLLALGLIPYTKPSGRLYFKVSDLNKFIENCL